MTFSETASAPNQERPLVSVCIANYNGMEVIDDCVESILNQEGSIPVEILIHDDASTDGSATYIEKRYPTARLIKSQDNVGFCIGNNRMATQAKGNYLLLLNNDAALFPDSLQTLLEGAERLDRPAILSLPQYDAQGGELIDRGCLLDPFFNPVPNLDAERQDVAMVIGACLWVPKDIWDEIGGLPEWFGSIAEDMYLCCRARLGGYPVTVIPGSGYRHHVGQSFGGGKALSGRLSTTFRRRTLSERNKTFVMLMTSPAPFMYFLLPVHLLLLLIEGLLLSILLGRTTLLWDIYLPVFGELYRQRDALRRGRRAAMRSRRTTRADFFSAFDPLPHKMRMLLRHGLPAVRK